MEKRFEKAKLKLRVASNNIRSAGGSCRFTMYPDVYSIGAVMLDVGIWRTFVSCGPDGRGLYHLIEKEKLKHHLQITHVGVAPDHPIGKYFTAL